MASSWSSTGCSGHSCNSWCRRALRAETGPCSRAASSTHACWMSTASPAQFRSCVAQVISSFKKIAAQRSAAAQHRTAQHSTTWNAGNARKSHNQQQPTFASCYAISTTSYTSGLLQDVFTTVHSAGHLANSMQKQPTTHVCTAILLIQTAVRHFQVPRARLLWSRACAVPAVSNNSISF